MGKCLNYIKHPKEYVSWCSMNQRTSSEISDPQKKKYYGNVVVCPRWKLSFESFLLDMGKAPSSEHTLDRIENSKGYFKDNCRWATPKEQANNRTNNVEYHIHQDSRGYWIVREYKDGKRKFLGAYPSRELVKVLYGV